MEIVARSRKNRSNEKMYIFQFSSMEEFEGFVGRFAAVEAFLPDIEEYVGKMKGRCDTKYATEDVACSFLLFEDEFLRYTTDISFAALVFAEHLADQNILRGV